MNIAKNSLYFPFENIEKENSSKLHEFKQFIYSERIGEALMSAQKNLFFDRIYLLVVKNNQKMSTFPGCEKEIEGKLQPLDSLLNLQLCSWGYVHITENSNISEELSQIMYAKNTKEFYLHPIYSNFEALTFLCCARTINNYHSSCESLDISNIQNMAIQIGECMDRIIYQRPICRT